MTFQRNAETMSWYLTVKHKPLWKCGIWITIFVVLWNEWLALKWMALYWPQVGQNLSNCSKILLVADPQLIGYQSEDPPWMGPVSRWDSDSYLSRGYAEALSHTDPHLVIFLGDLFDEGESAVDDELLWAYQRFKKIFKTEEAGRKEQFVYIAGDNDVGGEAGNVKPRLVETFRRMFASSDPFADGVLEGFEILEMNTFNMEHRVLHSPRGNITHRILLSHQPILNYFWEYMPQEISKKDIDLIISAHDHTAVLYERSRRDATRFTSHTIGQWQGAVRLVLHPARSVVELQIPTCNYRMGVEEMSFGSLEICSTPSATSTSVSFALLPLPKRFPQLYGYCMLISMWGLIVIRYILCEKIGCLGECGRRQYKKVAMA